MSKALATDSHISHYLIVSRIGAGGMGEVYLAEDTTLDRKVAIKILPMEATPDERANKRLIREAKAAAKLDHPNICSVYEVSETDGVSFIVMQYVEGETLASTLQQKAIELKESLIYVEFYFHSERALRGEHRMPSTGCDGAPFTPTSIARRCGAAASLRFLDLLTN
jgi:serine/threonine protein kinase